MELRIERHDVDQYRWRGDGVTGEVPAFDGSREVAGGAGRGASGPADIFRSGERGKQTIDSRLIHWDLLESDDEGSRTA